MTTAALTAKSSRTASPARSDSPIPCAQVGQSTMRTGAACQVLADRLPGRPDDDHHGVAAAVAHRRDRVVDIPASVRPGQQRLRRAEPASATRGEDQPGNAHGGNAGRLGRMQPGRVGLVATAVLVGLAVVGCTTSPPPTDARPSAAAPAEQPTVGSAAKFS